MGTNGFSAQHCGEYSGKVDRLEKDIKSVKDSQKWLMRLIITTNLSMIVGMIYLLLNSVTAGASP